LVVLTLVGAGALLLLLATALEEELAAELLLAAVVAEVLAALLEPADPVALPPAGARAAGFCPLEHPAAAVSRQAPNTPMRPLYTWSRFMSTTSASPSSTG
jgi:hypothetical protein